MVPGGGQLSSEAKEQIRSRLDIAEVIGEQVALKPAGRGQLKGLCPFHDEKTPSFHVHRDKGFFYCFGCQAKGDVYDFVMRTQGISFAEALRHLGERAGVEVTPPTPRDRQRSDAVAINGLAQEYFQANLRDETAGAAAREYLKARKISTESIEKFGIGFAPEGWDGLLRYALNKGHSDQELMAAGLLSENERGRRYDRFRNRLMFPIRDGLSRIVGFAGRVLDDSLPKYLNTPETETFRKSQLLYGLDLARPEIREKGECIVVEGYMDVIALHQVGIRNAVAALGATMTADQATLLSRLDVQRLYLAFDSDSAGQRAVLSGLEQAVGRQFLVRAVEVPHGKDPADAVLDGDPADFLAVLQEGLSEVEFRFSNVLAKYDPDTVQGQRAILEELAPALRPRSVFDPVASEMRRLVLDKLKMDAAALDAWVRDSSPRRLNEVQVRGMQRRAPGNDLGRSALLELEIIALLLREPASLEERLAALEGAVPPGQDSLLAEFRDICVECNYDDREVLLRYRERDEARVLWERLFDNSASEAEELGDLDAHLEMMLSQLRELYLNVQNEQHRQKLLERMAQLQTQLSDPDLPAARLAELYTELKELSSTLTAREGERQLRAAKTIQRTRRR